MSKSDNKKLINKLKINFSKTQESKKIYKVTH